MKKKSLLLLLVSIFLVNTILVAQEGQDHQEKKCFICKKSGLHQVHAPPYKTFTFKSELPILSGALGLSIISQLLPSPTPLTLKEINQLDEKNVNRFDRYAISQNSISAKKASDFFLMGVLVLPTLFLSNHHTRKDLIPLITMTGEVILLNYAITDIFKKIAKRTRPLAYNSSFSLEEKLDSNTRVSFFSGHTSHTAALSFLIAKVIDDYHPEAKRGIKIGIWTFAASIPAVTGYLRVRAGKHFPTDTITGFIAGGLVGVLVPHFHRREKKKTAKKINILPAIGVGYASLSVRF